MTQQQRRDYLQKGNRLHAENWRYEDFPCFKEGDIVWTYESQNVAQVVHHQDGIIIYTQYEDFHVLNVKCFVLQPDKPEVKLQEVDFGMLKEMLRHPGTTSVLSSLYSNPTQAELANLALFFERLGQSSSFAHLAHKKFQK